MTFQEIFDRVIASHQVTTRNPRATVRNALSQGTQLVSLGDGRYGYLPRLIEGSLVRLPLTGTKPAEDPLIYPDDVRQALFPSFFDIDKRKLQRPARLRLPTSQEVELALELLRVGAWGSTLPDGLRRYVLAERATTGDALLIRVMDGEAGYGQAWFEPRARRD